MKMRMKKFLGILLSISLVLGLMPGVPLTIHADELKTSENVSSDTAAGEEGNTEDKAAEEEPAAGSQTVSEDTVPEKPGSVSAPVAGEPEIEENAGDGEHVHDEISFTAWESTTSLPTTSGNYYLTGDVTISSTWQPKYQGTTKLCLNGYGIRFTGTSNAVISIYPETSLTIYDCNTQNREHYITLNGYRGTSVSDSGSETGIDSEGNGTVKVSGGYITGGNTTGSGGGVSVYGQFTMNGGSIIGNVISNGSEKNAGGVGVNSSGSSFEMNGGKIMFNKCTGDGTYGGGGGVSVANNAAFTMNGGVISGNKTTKSGGGVNIIDGGTFNLNGGLITHNISKVDNYYGGGGIYAGGTNKLKVQGNPVVTNNFSNDQIQNVCLPNGKTISIAGTLSPDASIGVTMKAAGGGVFTSGLAGNGTAKNFKSDDTDRAVYINAGGEAELGHGHKMTYSATGSTITATCSNNVTPCTLSDNKITLTIMKPDMTAYGDGKSASASLNGLDDFNTATGLETIVSDISYSGRDGTTYGPSTTAPEAVGKYTASITVEGKTASVDYEISKGTAEVTTPPAANSLTYSGAAQALVTAGACTATCTMNYALGTDSGPNESYSESIPTATAAGTYYVWYKAVGNDNYDDSAEDKVAVTVGQKSVTAIGITASDKSYDGTMTATIDTTHVTFDGKADGDTLTVTGTGAFNNAGAGNGKTVNVTGLTLGVTASGNYVLSSAVSSCTANITQAPLTVTANDNTITYGAAPAGNGVSYDGFVNGETESDLGGSLTYNSTYSQYGDVGDYTITPTGLTSSNYDISFVSGDLTVTQLEAALGWTNTTLTFNNAPQVPTASVSNKVNSDDVTVVVTGAQTNVGTGYTATAGSLSGNKAGNYKLPADKTQAFAITKAEESVLSNIEQSFFKNSTSISIDSVSSKVPVNAGTVTGYAIGAGGVTKTGSVNVTASSIDATTGVISLTISNGAQNDTITVPVKITAQNYDCTFEVIITLVNKENPEYTAPQKIEALSYNGAEHALITAGTVTKGGAMLYSLSENGTYLATVPKGKDAGDYSVYYKVEETATVAGAGPTRIDVTIGKKAVTVKADDKSKSTGSGDPALTATVTGLVGTDTIVYSLSRNAGEAEGSYTITPSGNAVQGNYTVTYETGVFTIVSKPKAEAPDPSFFYVTGEIVSGQENGTIDGITTDMEYRYNPDSSASENTPGWTGWTDGTGQKLINCKPGSYGIRYKETEDEAPSDSVILVVDKGQKAVVTGTVKYKNGNAYANAVIYVTGPTGSVKSCKADENGSFRTGDFDYGLYKFEVTGETAQGGKKAWTSVEIDALTVKCDINVPYGDQNESDVIVTQVSDKTSESGIKDATADLEGVADKLPQDSSRVTMTITGKAATGNYDGKSQLEAKAAKAYKAGATVNKGVLDIRVEKRKGSETTVLHETPEVIEIKMHYDFTNRFDVRAWRYHEYDGGKAETTEFSRLSSRPAGNFSDGTCFMDRAGGCVYVYSDKFSSVMLTSTDVNVSYRVKFDSREGSSVASRTVYSGDKITDPVIPQREGHLFEGWYADEGFKQKWDFDKDTVTDDMILYAKWSQRGLWAMGLLEEYSYTGSRIKPVIRVNYNNVPIYKPSDYTISFKNNLKPGEATLIINGKGNYKSKKALSFNIIKTDLAKTYAEPDIITKPYKFNKSYNNIKPALYLNGKKLKLNTKKLTYSYINSEGLGSECAQEGEYTLRISADPDNPYYTGAIEIPLIVTTKPLMQQAKVKLETPAEGMRYTGNAITPVFSVSLEENTLIEGEDYTVSFNDAHTAPGTHKVTFTGKSERCFGKKTVAFKITGKYDLSNKDLSKVVIAENTQVATGGARPDVSVYYAGRLLKKGRDYTLLYENNKQAGSSAFITVKGKGDFSGSLTENFTVKRCDMNDLNILIDDRRESDKPGDYMKAPVRFINLNGKIQTLARNVDYNISYSVLSPEGKKLSENSAPAAGSIITAVITGTGNNYEGSVAVNYRIKRSYNDLSKARVTLSRNALYKYTGSSITPTENDIEVSIGGTRIKPEYYEITGCFNNVNKGKATIYVRGKGLYYGTRKAVFKINSVEVTSIWSGVIRKLFGD